MSTPFRLRKDAAQWFRPLDFEVEFDAYYCCLIAGLAAGSPDPGTSVGQTKELVDYFPEHYRSRSRLIIGFFLSRELKQLGIGLSERHILHGKISELVDPQSPSGLSETGVRRMNEYAAGGFDVLLHHFPTQPQRQETFLPMYWQIVQQVNVYPEDAP